MNIVCANVGDSRASLVQLSQLSSSLCRLSRDHTPLLPEERQRIIKAGGRISPCKDIHGQPVGPPRIWDKNEDGPGLMMSRSFGDLTGHKIGMTALPEVKIHTRTQDDKVLIIGSDGLWDKLSDDYFVSISKQYYSTKGGGESICKQVVTEASKQWDKECVFYRDDISCITVILDRSTI